MVSMAKWDNLLQSRKEGPRLGFLGSSNRKGKAIDGDNLLREASSSALSSETQTLRRSFGVPCCSTGCVDESSHQASNPDSGASSSSRDLMDSTRQIPARNEQKLQSKKTQMNDASAPEVKKSLSNKTPVSRLSKQKEELVGKRPTNRTLESEQLKPLKDADGSARTSAVSRNRELVNVVEEKTKPPRNPTAFFEKKEKLRPPKNTAALVDNGGTSTILASRHGIQKNGTAQASKDPVEVIENIGTKRMAASKHVKDKKETTSRIPMLKQSEKQESSQPSKGKSGLVRKTRTIKALPSYQVSQKIKKPKAAKSTREEESTYDHIVWEGFDEGIEPFEQSCLLCEGDLSEDPEYNPDAEHLSPAETAVLSCGHVFHSVCLQMATSEDDSRDPPCFTCLSLS